MQDHNTSQIIGNASFVLAPDWNDRGREATEIAFEAGGIVHFISRALCDATENEAVNSSYLLDCAAALEGCSRLMFLSAETFDRMNARQEELGLGGEA